MRADRAAAGLSGAGILVVLAFAPGGWAAMTYVLLAAAFGVVLGTFAPILPALHRLPGVGLPTVTLNLTVENAQSFSSSDRMVDQVLRIGIVNDGPGDLRRVRLNTLIPLPHQMRPSDEFGNVMNARAQRLPNTNEQLIVGANSGAWAEAVGDVDEDALLVHYRLYFTEPGTWPVRVKLASPSLYRRRQMIQDIDVSAVRRADEAGS
jgi:hypothetical protein